MVLAVVGDNKPMVAALRFTSFTVTKVRTGRFDDGCCGIYRPRLKYSVPIFYISP